MPWCALVAIPMVLMGACAPPAGAQESTPEPEASAGVINLFFDCQGVGCRDGDFLRRQIPLVNWVRDREVSDLHVLVTSQSTGGGGQLHTLAFIGRRGFDGENQELIVSTSGDATSDEQRQVISDRVKAGLVRYLLSTAAADQIDVSLGSEGGVEGSAAAQVSSEQDDPWNSWAFRIGGNGFLRGESSFSSADYSGNASANRTTEAWKFTLSGRFNRRNEEFVVSDTLPPVVSLIEDWDATSVLVKSLTPQWSAGIKTGAGRSSRLNEELRWNISPGVEYNFVPYSESSRRAFTLQALMNLRHWDYTDETVYFKSSETRFAPSLTAAVNQIEPWGRTSISVTGSQFVHDLSLYQVSVQGFISVRLFRGFSVNLNGSYGLVRDQLYLPAGEASTEEILLQQRQLQTSFEYFTVFGFSYQFGSIFNNVVNPRFGGGERRGFFF